MSIKLWNVKGVREWVMWSQKDWNRILKNHHTTYKLTPWQRNLSLSLQSLIFNSSVPNNVKRLRLHTFHNSITRLGDHMAWRVWTKCTAIDAVVSCRSNQCRICACIEGDFIEALCQVEIVHGRKDFACYKEEKNWDGKVSLRNILTNFLNSNFNFIARKSRTGGPTFEMRWCQAEEFQEFRVMPRMVLDHLPDNVFNVLTTVLEDQKTQKDSKVSLQSL